MNSRYRYVTTDHNDHREKLWSLGLFWLQTEQGYLSGPELKMKSHEKSSMSRQNVQLLAFEG